MTQPTIGLGFASPGAESTRARALMEEHFGGGQPNFLVLIAGPFTIASMYAFALVIGYLNSRLLPAELAPSLAKRIGMVGRIAQGEKDRPVEPGGVAFEDLFGDLAEDQNKQPGEENPAEQPKFWPITPSPADEASWV